MIRTFQQDVLTYYLDHVTVAVSFDNGNTRIYNKTNTFEERNIEIHKHGKLLKIYEIFQASYIIKFVI